VEVAQKYDCEYVRHKGTGTTNESMRGTRECASMRRGGVGGTKGGEGTEEIEKHCGREGTDKK